jgi:hypothetical protein
MNFMLKNANDEYINNLILTMIITCYYYQVNFLSISHYVLPKSAVILFMESKMWLLWLWKWYKDNANWKYVGPCHNSVRKFGRWNLLCGGREWHFQFFLWDKNFITLVRVTVKAMVMDPMTTLKANVLDVAQYQWYRNVSFILLEFFVQDSFNYR